MRHDNKAPLLATDVYQDLLDHPGPMVWAFSFIMLVAIALTFLVPKTYTSEAKLFVRLGRESVSLDPTVATNQMVAVNEPRENEINSVFELLKSRAVLSGVVDAMGAKLVLGEGDNLKEGEMQTASVLPALNLFQPYSIEDAALKHLSKNLNIKAVKKSKIINISYDADTPELARDVVAQVIAQGRDAHVRVNRTDGSQQFFATQAEQLRGKLGRLEGELRELKNSSGVASLADQRVMALQQITDLQNSMWKTEAALRASTAELQAQQAILKKTPSLVDVGKTVGMPHSAVEAMREQLFALQVREQEMLSLYSEEYPLTRAIRAQVVAAREALEREPVTAQASLGPNPAYQEINVALVKSEAQTASLQAHATALRDQLVPVRMEVNKLNDHELTIARLEREIDLETANYKKYAENLEQARIDHELEMSSISNLNVLQPPTYSITPTKPRIVLNLALGFAGALAGGLGVGLVAERRRRGNIRYGELYDSPESAAEEPNTHHAAPTEWHDSAAASERNGSTV